MKFCRIFLIFLMLTTSGCFGSGDSSPTSNASPSPDPSAIERSQKTHDLYNADVAAFSSLDEKSISDFDSQTATLHQFSNIFGGTTSQNVLDYYNARIHTVMTSYDAQIATWSPGSFSNENWLSNSTNDDSKVVVVALNISTLFWLEGVVNQVNVVIHDNGQTIPIDSTRVGVMELGPGYVASETGDDGKTINLPTAYRQAVLLHEARHSDCSGGLSEAEIKIMENADSLEDYEEKVPRPHCGHLHITCPESMDVYGGLAACDSEKWGAYTIAAIYEQALLAAQTDDVSQSILEITIADYQSRYIPDTDLAPESDTPDMSSSGVRP